MRIVSKHTLCCWGSANGGLNSTEGTSLKLPRLEALLSGLKTLSVDMCKDMPT